MVLFFFHQYVTHWKQHEQQQQQQNEPNSWIHLFVINNEKIYIISNLM